MMLRMRLAGDEKRDDGCDPRKRPSKPAFWQRRGKIISGMLIKAAKGAKTGDEAVEENITAATTNDCQRDEIGQYDLQEEIRPAHIARADALAGARRMMQAVPERLHQARPVQNEPVGDVLDDIMSNTDQHHIGYETQRCEVRCADESQSHPLHEKHGREKDEDLIGQHTRQQLPIAQPIDIAHFARTQIFMLVTPFEGEANAMVGDHLNGPGNKGQRQEPRQNAIVCESHFLQAHISREMAEAQARLL